MPRAVVPSRPHKVLRLDLGSANLVLLCALLDLCDECLFLLLKLHPDLVQFADCLVEHALVLAQTLSGRHALSKSPF